ncbi:MAG: ABC transporter ATP-binding protein [Lachnospiraceae bacterium]|nr:ABC transporter ATP-binding protein [Lachnospiraceae bacterium]
MEPKKKRIPMIVLHNLRKEYRTEDECIVALDTINLTLYKGELCCIFGTSGSGKSTLLNQLAGMEKPTSGSVWIDRKCVSSMDEEALASFRQHNTGFIFQSYNLLPALTAVENVALPLMFRGISKEIREQQAAKLLKKVGLGHRLTHFPTQMSGGQQQRVGIARAFVTRPKVIFADEPTGNLDTRTTRDIMHMITDFSVKYAQTIVLVTHDKSMADYADRIITLCDGHIISDERKTNHNEA